MWYMTPLVLYHVLVLTLLYPSTAGHIKHLVTRYSNVWRASCIDMYSEWYATGSVEGELDFWENTNPGDWVG